MSDEIKNNIEKAQIFLKNKDFDNAEIVLLRNLKISDKNFKTFFLLGAISGIKKKLDEAEAYFKKSISLNSSHINSILNLAIILKKNNKKQDSIFYFEKVVSLDDRNIESLCGLAQIYEEQKNYKKSECYFKKALDIDPNHHIANHSYGKLLLKLNQHTYGLKLIEKVSGIIRFKNNSLEII